MIVTARRAFLNTITLRKVRGIAIPFYLAFRSCSHTLPYLEYAVLELFT